MTVKEIVSEFKTKVEDLYGQRLKNVILYGSYARGDATEDSDIDLLVILDGEVKPGREIDRMIEAVTDINLKHDVLLSICPVSEEEYIRVNSPLYMNIRREGLTV